jgi:glutaredoxin
MAKKFFADNNLEYTEHNVQEDTNAQQEMVAKSHQLGVPVIDVDGEIFVGFDRNALAQALKVGQ